MRADSLQRLPAVAVGAEDLEPRWVSMISQPAECLTPPGRLRVLGVDLTAVLRAVVGNVVNLQERLSSLAATGTGRWVASVGTQSGNPQLVAQGVHVLTAGRRVLEVGRALLVLGTLGIGESRSPLLRFVTLLTPGVVAIAPSLVPVEGCKWLRGLAGRASLVCCQHTRIIARAGAA